MSLTSCLKKAGTALRPQDKVAVLALSRQYRRQGMTPDAAAIKAIDDQLVAVGKLVAEEQATYEELLKAPTKAEILAKQDQTDKEAKAAKAGRRAETERAQEEDDRKRIAQASEAAADSFELGGDALDNLTGQGGLFANEPTTAYNSPYETDLFGNPLPSTGGKTGSARSERAGVRGDVQSKSTVSDTPTPAGEYYANTIIGSESNRELGAPRIVTAEHAAQATRYLYKSAVERLDGIVTDRNHKPLAVIGGFKGTISQASVYPSTLMSEAIRIPGAAHIWFSHNHPSGVSRLSKADIRLNETLSDVFRGSGIEPMGLLAVGEGTFSYVDGNGGGEYDGPKALPEPKSKVTVPVMERQLAGKVRQDAVDSPAAARSIAKTFYDKAKAPGVLLLNSQNEVAAWLPISQTMQGPLRGTGSLASLYRAVSQSNAGAAILVHGGELDVEGNLPAGVTPGENIAAALAKVDVRPLDSINVKTGRSAAEVGQNIAGGPVFARGALDDAFRRTIAPRSFMPISEVQKAIDQLTAKWKDGPRVEVVRTPAQLPLDAPNDARGLIHNGTAYIVAANHRDRHGVALTLGHEAIGHYGLWKMLGADGTSQFQRQLQAAIKSGNVPLNKIATKVRELYTDGDGKFNLSPAQEANEIAAFAVEDAIGADGNFKPGYGFFKQVWAKVADFLRGLGIDIKFTNAELQGMLVSAMRGLETGSRMDGGAQGLVAAARDGQTETDVSDPKTGVSKVLLELGQNDDLYQYPRSYSVELQHIADDKATPERGAITVSDVDKASDNNKLWMLANTTPDDNPANGVKSWILTMPSGKLATLTKKGNEVYINVSGVGEGMGGSAVYDLAANYALNNGLVFIGDPNGVSAAAMRRRLENMLSSAVKYGTTDHLKPHPDQYLGNEAIGVPPLDWTNGDTLSNIRHMVDVSIAATEHLNPKASENVRFDTATQSFRDGDNHRLDDERVSEMLGFDGRASGAGQGGRATLQRSALFKSLVQSEGARRAFLVQLRRQQDSGSEAPSGELKGSFYARGGQGNGTGVTAGLFAPTVWNTPDPTSTDRIIYELQDGRVDLKRVQEAITKSGQQIEEKWDARLAETLYPGRVAYRSQRFLETEAHPLLKAMAVQKVPMDELADYLHARGAEERNKQIAKVNPELPDGGAGKNSKGVLLTNDAARDYLANINPERKKVLDVLAAKVDAITAGTRTLLVAEGLEKQETIDAWTSTYKNYVPMFRDEAQSGAPHPQGSGFSVKGSASKRATGSTKEVTNILAHVLMQREAAITRAEKNRVAVALYGQALSHPNPEFWTTIKPNMTHAQIGAELQAMGVDPATAAVGMERAPTITTVDEATGKKVDRPNPLYKSLPGAIPLKVNAEDRVLMINTETVRGARLAENLKNLDGLTKLDLAGFIIGKATRWLASVNTQYNPAFGLVNVMRDTLGAAVNLGSTELRGSSLKVLRDTMPAMQGIARELATGKGGKWGDRYRQFQADGGQTGFKELFRDANERAKAVEKELKAAHSAGKLTPGNTAHAVLDLLDGFNTTMENAVRLSAYSAALDDGMSRANAARLARELTVDFNRKGRAGRELGPLYAFFNASVQGTARTMQAIKGPTGAKIIAGGLALGVTQALMLMAAGYDDDEVPEFVKSRALVVPLNWSGKGEKSHVLVHYPLGLHVIPNTGRIITELSLNGAKDMGKRIAAAIGEIAGAFNPMGGGNVFAMDGLLKTMAPTLVDPLIEHGFNRNFAGNTIERPPLKGETDTRPGVARTKEATQRSTTGQAYMGISKVINSMTGGTDYEAGKLSPTPEILRYYAQTVGGGVLREIEKTINATTAASYGKDVKPSALPVVGRFYGEVDSAQVKTSRYFDNSTKLDKLETTAKTMTKAGDAQALEKLHAENPEIALVGLGNKVQSAVSKLNKAAVQSVNDPDGIRTIDQDRVELMNVLNQAVADLENDTKPPTPAAKIKSWRRETVTP